MCGWSRSARSIPGLEPATYAPMLKKEEGKLDFSQDAESLERRVRAFNPWPGTFTTLAGDMLKVLAAAPAQGAGVPGTVLDDRLTVACGEGALRLLKVQRSGRAAMEAEAFLRGYPVPPGTRLG